MFNGGGEITIYCYKVVATRNELHGKDDDLYLIHKQKRVFDNNFVCFYYVQDIYK